MAAALAALVTLACAAARAHAGTSQPESMQWMLDKLKTQMTNELETQLNDLLQRQRELLLAAPVLPGGRFDPSLHPARYPWRHALLGALTTAVAVALTWFCWYRHRAHAARLERRSKAAKLLQQQSPADVQRLLEKVLKTRDLPRWISFPDFDRVDWLNSLMGSLWPHVTAAATNLVHEQLDPQLKVNKPRWIADISLSEFSLGDKPPQVTGIKVYHTDAASDTVVLEAEAMWASHQDVQLTVRLLPRHVPGLPERFDASQLLLAALNKFVFLRVGVMDLSFSGRVRITLTGLMNQLPVISAAQVSLVEIPDFSFAVTLYEYVNLMILPGLESFIHYFIRDIILRPLVLPESVNIALVPGAEAAAPKPQGMLFVRVCGATDVPRFDWKSIVSKPDTFVSLSVRHKQRKKTAVAWNRTSPAWDADFQFLVHFPDHQELSLKLMDHDRVWGDTEIGHVTVPLRTVQPGHEHDVWLDVKQSAASNQWNVSKVLAAAVGGRDASGRVAVDRLNREGAEVGPGPADDDRDVELAVTSDDSSDDDDLDHAAGDADVAGSGSVVLSGQASPSARLLTDGQRQALGEALGAPGGEFIVQDSEGDQPATAQPDDTTAVAAQPAEAHGGTTDGSPSGDPPPSNGPQQVPEAGSKLLGGGRKRAQHCRLHLKMTYLPVGEATMRRAEAADPSAPTDVPEVDGQQQEFILQALRGGVLEVRIRHPSRGIRAGGQTAALARQVLVEVAGKQKRTAEASGESAERSEETLEFLIGGDIADRPGVAVHVEVWDNTFVADDNANLTWEMSSFMARATEPRKFDVPLRDVIRRRKVHRLWRLAGTKGREVLDIELRWLGVMSDPDAAT